MEENGGPQTEAWSCSSTTGRECAAMFQNLFDLVSHVRSVHMNFSINSVIDDCLRIFSSENIWYQDQGNIRKGHLAGGSEENASGFRNGTYWISD